jgi:hypothetical protein
MKAKIQPRNAETICSSLLAAIALLLTLTAACSQTVSEQSAVEKQVQSGQSAASEFLGGDVSLLQPGQAGQAAMVYINPNAQWSQYDKIMLEPVEFWDSTDTKVSPSDQHMLTAYAYNKLKEDLQKNFTLVDQGGPGVLVLQVALVNTSAATPGLRSVSVVIPQLRVINMVQSLATGSYPSSAPLRR